METEVLIFNNIKKPSFFKSIRFLLAISIFWGTAIQYMQKIDMGIAIVCMINNTAIKGLETHHRETVNPTDNCMFHPTNTSSTDGPFSWNKQIQGFILSSYFYGYIITQVPSGWLAMKYGGKIVLGMSIFIGSIFTILASPSARLSPWVLVICRFLTGLAHGACWPAVAALWANWAPPLEKSRLIGFASSGSYIGNVLALPIGGWLCVNGFDGGWGSIFEIFGIVGIVWFTLFMLLNTDHPNAHKFISNQERIYINDATGSIQRRSSQKTSTNQKMLVIPWRRIFKSKPCLALFISHMCSNWCNYLFLTQLPTFMKEVLLFDIKSNGLFSSLPYICSWLCAGLSGIIGDKLIANNSLNKTTVRKIFNGIGLIVPMIASVLLSFVTCANPYLGVALLTIGVGFIGCSTGAGYIVNINELGGAYSGVLFGISNVFGTLSGIVAPFIVSVITKNQKQEEWRIVFLISAGIYLFGAIVYTLFASSSTERWAHVEDSDNDEDDI